MKHWLSELISKKEKRTVSLSDQHHYLDVCSFTMCYLLPLCVLVLISGSPFGDWSALTAPPGGDSCDSAGVGRVGCQPPGCVYTLCAQVGHVAVHPQLVVKKTSQGSQRDSPADVQLVSAEHHHCQSTRSVVLDVSCADLHLREGPSDISEPHCTHT